MRPRRRARLCLPPRPQYALRRRLSGADFRALLDRIDLHIEVPAVTAADLILPPPTEGSREVAERVALARERQAARYAAIGLSHIHSNAAVSGAILEDVARRHCPTVRSPTRSGGRREVPQPARSSCRLRRRRRKPQPVPLP
jgi:predicted ATPase with chaperone activity